MGWVRGRGGGKARGAFGELSEGRRAGERWGGERGCAARARGPCGAAAPAR